MPTLLLSPNYNTPSKILRKAAHDLGWKTFRLEDDSIPPSLEPEEDGPFAIYCTVPDAFNVAHRLDSILLGCGSGWLTGLPEKFLKRKIEVLALAHAESIKGKRFIKPALGKSFEAAVKHGHELTAQAARLPPDLAIHVSEIVEWETEYRCFVKDKKVLTLSPYRQGDVRFSSYDSPLAGPRQECEEAREFAESVANAVPCPKAFVLDVGFIRGNGWAVIEPNECWGAGIYGCAPEKVLDVLLAATVRKTEVSKDDARWDYARHYFEACPHMKNSRSW